MWKVCAGESGAQKKAVFLRCSVRTKAGLQRQTSPVTRFPFGPKLSNVSMAFVRMTEAPLCCYRPLWLWKSPVLSFVIVARQLKAETNV